MNDTLTTLKEQFDLDGKASLKAGRGGLPCVQIKTSHAAATIYLHGAHITHFQPMPAEPVLFMSEKSLFQENQPIRGGVPICFPWFGPNPNDPDAPAHGFARLLPWTLKAITEQSDGSIVVLMTLRDSEKTRELWPHPFELSYRITVGTTLTMSLEMHNTGHHEYTFEEALHTYFATNDVRRVMIAGLENTTYLDKMAQGETRTQNDRPITITGETDRVYNHTGEAIIDDPSRARKILIQKSNSASTVVWNPWIDKAKAMADFDDDRWPAMLCVETANVKRSAVYLPPGARHTMTAVITLSSR
jgi:glucose-6-phosphate 1-epimerase